MTLFTSSHFYRGVFLAIVGLLLVDISFTLEARRITSYDFDRDGDAGYGVPSGRRNLYGTDSRYEQRGSRGDLIETLMSSGAFQQLSSPQSLDRFDRLIRQYGFDQHAKALLGNGDVSRLLGAQNNRQFRGALDTFPGGQLLSGFLGGRRRRRR